MEAVIGRVGLDPDSPSNSGKVEAGRSRGIDSHQSTLEATPSSYPFTRFTQGAFLSLHSPKIGTLNNAIYMVL